MIIYKERKNTNCVKWDGCQEKFGSDDVLPLWVADMDFEVPECVKESLKAYIEEGVFGYYQPPKEYKEAFILWQEKYHDYKIEKEWMRFAPGVVPAFNWIVQMLTEVNDAVIVMPPVYYPFFGAVNNNGRKLIESPLIRTEQKYVMDYEDFEQKIVENQVKLFIFCSPHNPVGRVWEKDEIKKVLDICKKHHVYVIADEIHQDIIMSGKKQISAATAGEYDEIMITLTAATKTFNLAGCQNSIIIIPDDKLRIEYDRYTEQICVRDGNAFGYIAVQSAYESGREWFEEVLGIIEGNYHLMKEMLEERLPEVWIPELEGTYLMWIDLSKYVNANEMETIMQEKCKLAVDYGSWFGGDKYAGFIRVNLATKPENIKLAASRIIEVLANE